jgi:hypothetical protein
MRVKRNLSGWLCLAALPVYGVSLLIALGNIGEAVTSHGGGAAHHLRSQWRLSLTIELLACTLLVGGIAVGLRLRSATRIWWLLPASALLFIMILVDFVVFRPWRG